jgi:hypothetical protein
MFVGTLLYLEPKPLLLIIFYNGTFLMSKILIMFHMDVCTLWCIDPLLSGDFVHNDRLWATAR